MGDFFLAVWYFLIDNPDQGCIAVAGVVAIFLSQSLAQGQRKWSPVFGIIGQPFWFYTTYIHEQWGLFFLCFIYTISWLRGIVNYWIK